LGTVNKGKIAWHREAYRGHVETLQKVRELAEKKLTTEEISNKFLFVTDSDGMTAWHRAAKCGLLEILQKQWEWAEQNLSTEEINNNF